MEEGFQKLSRFLFPGWIKMTRMTISSSYPEQVLVYTCHPEVIINSILFHSQMGPVLGNEVYDHP